MKLFPLIQIHNMQTKPDSYYRQLLLSPKPPETASILWVTQNWDSFQVRTWERHKDLIQGPVFSPTTSTMCPVEHFSRNGDFSAKNQVCQHVFLYS